MKLEENTTTCDNPECNFQETGRCVEGFQLNECPHVGGKHQSAGGNERESEEQVHLSSIQLPSAGALSPKKASSVLRHRPARVVTVMGPSDSGKTSLVAGIYELFQRGPVDDTEFAQSQTLHDFEHACHDARASSRRTTPHMNRTPIGEVRFYHLEVVSGPNADRIALLLSDRAGEEYRSASDDIAVVTDFLEVTRADSLMVLIDGEKLLDQGARHNVRSDITMMLQALCDADALRRNQPPQMALVLTKLDAVEDSGLKDRVMRDFEALLNHLRQIFGSNILYMEPFYVAASPKTDKVERGYGLQGLLKFLLQPIPPAQESEGSCESPARAFARLLPIEEL